MKAQKALKLYYISEDYINYLRKFDAKVFINKNQTRPYVGIVYFYNGFNYFAPLASPKPKHLKMNSKAIDIFKIDNGNLGIINFNNMIPTPIECVTELIPIVKDKTYKILLENQLTYLNKKRNVLFKKIYRFQELYQKDYLGSIKDRCCDFSLLEKKCLEYDLKLLVNS